MDNRQFEATLREGECFHALRMAPDTWAVIRVDGHGFSRFTKTRFEKPFDAHFHEFMVQTAQTLLEQLQGVYAYTESDEISVLLPPHWNLFDRSVEKAVSISAGIASTTFSLACGVAAHFDSRVWLGQNEEQVVDYFRWRQADAMRCALNGWCYWTLRQARSSVQQATQALERQSQDEKLELLTRHDIAFEEVPAWQRQGVGLYWEPYEKEGYDPVQQAKVTAMRRRIKVDGDLPPGEAYAAFINRILDQDKANGL